MDGVTTIDMAATVGQLTAPSPSFRLFFYNEAKIMRWATHLKDDPLYVEDDARNFKNVLFYINWLLFGDCLNVIYEIGDGGGMMVFSAIIPGHKMKMDWHMWDKSLWCKSFAREGKALVDLMVSMFNLKRVWSTSAKPEIVKLMKYFGAKIEGVKKLDFKFDGKFYDSYMLAWSKED